MGKGDGVGFPGPHPARSDVPANPLRPLFHSHSNPAPPAANPAASAIARSGGRPGTAREAEHGGEHPPPDLLHPRRVRMDPVLLVEQGHGGHPFQQERVEDRPVPGGELRVDRVEPAPPRTPARGWGEPPCPRGERGGPARRGCRAGGRGSSGSPRGRSRRSPSFAPEGDDDRVRVVAKGPFEPGEPAGRGIARPPRVDHPRVDPVRAKDGLQPSGGARRATRDRSRR